MSAPSLEEQIAQLQAAIAGLEARRAELGDAAVETSLAALREKLRALSPEPAVRQRKLVTVLFADLVGFTPLAESLDPEDVRDLLERYFEPWRQAIGRFGGRLEKYIGDAVMAVFGVPAATELDAENAIRAALAVRDGLGQLNAELQQRFGVRLAMRVGIHTGPVLVAEARGVGDLAVTGDTVNLASRLEGQAPPGGILISHDTYRHVRGSFDVEVQERITVKGRAEPVLSYLVERARPRAFHRGMRGVEGIEAPMIGRAAELQQLQEALLGVVSDGRHRAVTVVGEAGVGKSRLLFEFENWADVLPQRFFLFKGRASQDRQGMPYGLIRDLFAFRFQIQDNDPAEAVRAKLEAGFGEALGQEVEAPAHFVGQLLGFDFSASPHLKEAQGDARQIRDRALVYLAAYFRAVTERLATAILLEDLHWADDSSLDLLDGLALPLVNRPLLIVGLARPGLLERRPGWGEGRAFHQRLDLDRLSTADCRRLVEEILREARPVPEALLELVTGQAEGNPFYVEELIKMLIEVGVILPGPERWRVEPARLSAVPVPPTLVGVLQARLDSLAPQERSVLQQASVVGRIFWDQAVARLGERAAPAAAAAHLAALRAKEMVFRRPTSAFAGTEEYIFKHALLRQVAYESVLRQVRREYHALVAGWLVEQAGERVAEHTGLIADHLEAAGEAQRAIPYLRLAGEEAAARFANAEAMAYLGRALALSPPEELAGRFGLLLDREAVCDVLGDRAAQAADLAELDHLAAALDDRASRAEAALRRARYTLATGNLAGAAAAAQAAIALAGEPVDARLEVEGYLHWGQALWRQSDFQGARPLLEKAVELARAGSLPREQALGLRHIGSVCWSLGDYAQAAQYYDQSLALCREAGDRRGEGAALNNLGLVHRRLGNWSLAQAYFDQALQIRRAIGDRLGEAAALNNLGGLTFDCGEYSQAQAYSEQALDVFRQVDSPMYEAVVLARLGSIAAARADYARARASTVEAQRILHSLGDKRLEGATLDSLGIYCTAQGDYSLALDYIRQALAIAEAQGDRQGRAACLLDLGELFRYLGDYATAAEHYQESLAISHDTGQRGQEGEVLTRLALLHHHRQEDASALEAAALASQIHRETGQRGLLAQALTVQGRALEGLGRADEADLLYREAQQLRRDLDQPHLEMEVIAALARTALARGDLPGARAHVEQILHHLDTGTLDGTEEPFRIYLTCCRVLQAAHDPRALHTLRAAHALLRERAERIDDPELRRSFLENVGAHRDLAREFASASS